MSYALSTHNQPFRRIAAKDAAPAEWQRWSVRRNITKQAIWVLLPFNPP